MNILRLKQLTDCTGLSKSTIYAMIKIGNFPKPKLLGARSVGWLECDVNNWIESRVSKQGGA